jgi:polyisoprenoid-binding protein YceI
MKKVIYGIFAFTLMAGVACNQSPKGTKVEASDTHKMEMTADADGIAACPHQSKIYWKGTKPTGEHTGFIKLEEGGKFMVEDNQLVGGEFIIDMHSIVDVDIEDEEMNAKLVGHLKSADFFHADSFPTAKFVITSVEALTGDEAFTHLIKGNLTMKDITKGIEFKANVKLSEGAVSATSEEFVLDRTQWNVNYGSKSIFKEIKDNFIHDEFSLKIEVYSM